MGSGLYLGFDFGERRIGVAVGQLVTGTARALETVSRPPRMGVGIHWPRISELLQVWQPQALVVGMPLHLDGTPIPFGQRAQRFGQQLAGRYRLPVFFADERLTSAAAASALREQGRYRGEAIDAEAAAMILTSWLEAQRRLYPNYLEMQVGGKVANPHEHR
ncbi:MAG: Holliday junction resolvase RuvX [Gammaproteobacteria bacterium]|nr:Holliday junction resolvase RuvX [Gammaproteobacteria bacterium]